LCEQREEDGASWQLLLGNFVSARFAAGRAIHQAIFAETDAELGLAQAAISFARTLRFGHLTLHTEIGFC